MNNVLKPREDGKIRKVRTCMYCGYAYDEAKGCPDSGIAPGTRWEDIPEDWCCPVCSAGKSDFEEI
jgi:rubredoxin---NAD+ reductase